MKIDDLKGIKRGRLRLGVITTAKYFAPELLGEFCKQFPGVGSALKVSNRDRILERICANEDDLYIMGQAPEGQPDVEALAFAPNPLVVMAPRDHPGGRKEHPARPHRRGALHPARAGLGDSRRHPEAVRGAWDPS